MNVNIIGSVYGTSVKVIAYVTILIYVIVGVVGGGGYSGGGVL